MSTTHAIGSGRPFFDLPTVRLISYRHVWVRRDDYLYECKWSDGTTTLQCTLPWGRLDGVVEL